MPRYTEYQKVFRIAKNNAGKPEQRTRTRDRGGHSAWDSEPIEEAAPDHQLQDNAGLVTWRQELAQNGARFNATDNVSNISEAQHRLQQLERVVASLVQANGEPPKHTKHPAPPYSDPSTQNANFPGRNQHLSPHEANKPSDGRLEIRGSETNYTGSTHWETILADIKDIQDCLAGEVELDSAESSIPPHDTEPDIVFDDAQPVTLDEAVALLPTRQMCDKLLSVLFGSRYLSIPFIHRGKFLREYESFWNDPSSVPYLWVSLLFSALAFGSWMCHVSGWDDFQLPIKLEPWALLRPASQVLVAGQYQKARKYSVEAMLMYALCKFFLKEDPTTEPWLLMGLSARMALKMGYHRDPRHLAHVSPFQGEMRRRTFSMLQMFDLLLSFQAGLPATIHEDDCDTEPPRNLFDDDFDEDTEILPPSRPETTPTPILYHCCKSRIARVFRKISRHALSPIVRPYEETMKLDGDLRKAQASLPPSLVMRPIPASITAEAHLILDRFNIEVVYQTGLMVLHRKYLSYEKSNPAFNYSRKVCLEASLALLNWQAQADLAGQPGGRLHNDRWLASSLTLHDFLLATMIACLYLYESKRPLGAATKSAEEIELQKQVYHALQISQGIWVARKESSRDARRASTILDIMMTKISDAIPVQSQSALAPARDKQTRGESLEQQNSGPGNLLASISKLSTSEDGLQFPTSFEPDFDAGDFFHSDTIEGILKDTEVDWGLVDQYLFGGSTPSEMPPANGGT